MRDEGEPFLTDDDWRLIEFVAENLPQYHWVRPLLKQSRKNRALFWLSLWRRRFLRFARRLNGGGLKRAPHEGGRLSGRGRYLPSPEGRIWPGSATNDR